MTNPRPPYRIGGDAFFALWRRLADAAAQTPAVEDLFRGYCVDLAKAGLPISRASLGLEVLHPEVSGALIIWTDGTALTVRESERAGIVQSPSYQTSPLRVVDETDKPYRRRLDQPCPDMPLLEELRLDGHTDYLMLPLPFLDRSRSATISFATRAERGMDDATIDLLREAARLFSPYAERFVLRRIALDLLNTYVGSRAGQRVYDGRIERGSHELMQAAIWFADLRGFTRLSERLPVDELIALLNRWFGAMAEVIEPHGGEILKFIGDAILAVFPAGDDRLSRAACAEARAAAAEFAAAMQQAGLRFALALHYGEVAYGNVGARNRLDFTVIGPAVNLAARLQGLAKTLGRSIIASEAFARHLEHPLLDLGMHRLTGVGEAQRVFTI